jgi:outer membrane biosynthesis protein TonB
MNQKVCLKNASGQVVRILPIPDVDKMVVTRNPDDHRLMFRPAYEKDLLVSEGWDILKEVTCDEVLSGSVKLTPELTLAKFTDNVIADPVVEDADDSVFRKSALLSILLGLLLVSIMLNMPKPTVKEVEEEVKQQVVKIIKQQKAEVIKLSQIARSQPTPQTKNTPQAKSTNAIKRMGALAALGSLSNSKQQGGLDLGAVAKSAGPGLGGGTQGSGGVQTSLYGKGIVSAPLGVGGNLNGAGGYGTKGKGGGSAGYGKLSLVGSAGTSVVPVGTEVISGGGLSNEDIWAVIRRNQGQIRFCYEQGLQSDPKLKGTVRTNFTINSNGQVAAISIAGTTLNSKIVEDCISLRIKSWKFPLPQGGKSISVQVPFNLTKQGQG